ncbi:hypothetical protein [Arthrobacter sp. efr-133-TYG-118]|uniref:hypothetical protein n=1 Tax=Arthrobacter sp. efr-133-TYG-118 TaxID=3040279 RepID=UPI00254D195B|nr:hypothetical protein [Arthrobacter sp. efr-133-TYG-118]
MSITEPDDEWDPRIGKEAARMRQGAYQHVRYFFISGAVTIAMAFIAMMSQAMPLWLSVLSSVVVLTWVFFVILAWSTFSVRMKRAGRLTYEYLGRPPQLRKGIFPPVMLREPARFDSHMALRGIPPKGNYVPIRDAATDRILAKRNKHDRAR